eukprot:scaffold88906_cov30-Tisochrysis_lutea.AAC.5
MWRLILLKEKGLERRLGRLSLEGSCGNKCCRTDGSRFSNFLNAEYSISVPRRPKTSSFCPLARSHALYEEMTSWTGSVRACVPKGGLR